MIILLSETFLLVFTHIMNILVSIQRKYHHSQKINGI